MLLPEVDPQMVVLVLISLHPNSKKAACLNLLRLFGAILLNIGIMDVFEVVIPQHERQHQRQPPK